ncbi:MAG: efflux RND transporter periplasmic adaptor subunit [Sphingomonadales bacterium]
MRMRLEHLLASMVVATVAGCGDAPEPGIAEDRAVHEETEKGPHGGRLLRDGDFALEVAIHETGVPPQFRLYAYEDGERLAPGSVSASITLSRLGGEVDRFSFRPEQDYLAGDGVVAEPHSFDVAVTASHAGKRRRWSYPSHEGRTRITAAAAAQSGVESEAAGPASIPTTVELLGRLAFAPGADVSVKARFPGKVQSMSREVGDTVRAGETLARVESNESLQSYSVSAPIGGVIIERNGSAGDVTGDQPIYRIGDPKRVIVDFHVFDKDMGRVRPGQEVEVSALGGGAPVRARIETFVPVTEAVSQTVVARARLSQAPPGWMPGMTVKGEVIIEQVPVPLAVRDSGLQRFRDFDVVFAKVGEIYEVRMLELGRRGGGWVEVLGGLEPGTDYVTENSFLIKADIEKSGASHDH